MFARSEAKTNPITVAAASASGFPNSVEVREPGWQRRPTSPETPSSLDLGLTLKTSLEPPYGTDRLPRFRIF
jgi:hypothetical protein